MSKNINVPKLRFKEFSEEWEDKLFGEIYTFLQTNSFSRALLNYEFGEVKNIHYGDIHTKFKSNFYLEKENVPYINEDIDISKLTNDNFCREKDLVIADASEDYKDIGKTIEIIDLNNEKLVAGLHTYIARDTKDKMALGFGGYFMQTYNIRLQMMKFATGISVLGISKSNLVKIKIKIPQKQEQEKIAIFLSSIDEKIEKLTKKDELLQQYKKSIMQKIFSQEIRFKDDKGKEFPEWEEKKMGDVSKLQGGYAFKSNEFIKEGIPVIRISNISNNNNYIDDNNMVYYNEISNDKKFSIKNGDLLVAMSGATTGKSSIYNLSTKAYLNQRVGLFKTNEDKLYYKYLVQFVFSDLFISQLNGVLVSGAQPNISSKDIEEFKLNLPCLKEQNKIANFLSSIDYKIEENQKQLEKTKEFKKSLLQQMFV
ncbi:restriction endonuclease subunit S [Aliarcobacter thereius]|uniref:restriction endonuclease subunit S n=1 Tax=Aliarcobacter thereius TaxID=544718 RepID=UPI001BB2C40B|nr:restriction endonuclease subunit S [Aliarcobacter thereius]